MTGTRASPSDASNPLKRFQPSNITFIDHKLGHADLRRMDTWPVHTFTTWEDFQEGQVLLIDKPREWTSFDVVNKVRYAIRKGGGFRKIKVGHAGTLDPLATGVLVVCTGRMTKRINELTAEDKAYEGHITFGSTTESHDLETCLLYTSPSPRDMRRSRMPSSA